MIRRVAPGVLRCCQQTLFGYFIGLQCVYVYKYSLVVNECQTLENQFIYEWTSIFVWDMERCTIEIEVFPPYY